MRGRQTHFCSALSVSIVFKEYFVHTTRLTFGSFFFSKKQNKTKQKNIQKRFDCYDSITTRNTLCSPVSSDETQCRLTIDRTVRYLLWLDRKTVFRTSLPTFRIYVRTFHDQTQHYSSARRVEKKMYIYIYVWITRRLVSKNNTSRSMRARGRKSMRPSNTHTSYNYCWLSCFIYPFEFDDTFSGFTRDIQHETTIVYTYIIPCDTTNSVIYSAVLSRYEFLDENIRRHRRENVTQLVRPSPPVNPAVSSRRRIMFSCFRIVDERSRA